MRPSTLASALVLAVATLLLTAGLLETPDAMPAAAARPNLYWGSRGDAVRQAQQRLKDWGYYNGPVDGVFGPKMSQAVRRFQRNNGLTADGIVGSRTWEAMGLPAQPARRAEAPRRSAPAPQGTRQDDVYLLAQAASAEARGEPYEGQVAVAAVILNRVRHPSFPDTIAGVIFQPGAFESVSNGTIYSPPSQESMRAARDALNGWDPSGGATFFWNPAKATSSWIWSRPRHAQIGEHVFAR